MNPDRFDPRNYWEKRLSSEFSLKGVGDITLSKAFNEYMYRVRGANFDRLVRKYAPYNTSLKVLDIGSGTGFYIEKWLEIQPEKIVGCDLTESSVSILSSRFPDVPFFRVDITTTDDIDKVGSDFNFVSMIDVVFHIVDDQKYYTAMKNVASLLKPGSHFLLSENMMREDRLLGSHQVARSEAQVATVLKEAGFRIVNIQPMFFFMNDPVRSHSYFLQRLWHFTTKLADSKSSIGSTIGAILYPIELAMTSILARGPSTEFILCEKL